MNQFLIELDRVTKDDEHIVGKTAVNLAEMMTTGFPIPEGFVVTADAYFAFLQRNKLIPKINQLLETINFERPESTQQVALHIKKMIIDASFDDTFIAQVYAAYKKLSGPLKDIPVTITSTKEIFHSVSGDTNLILKIKESWADLFAAYELIRRQDKNINHFRESMAIIIQREIKADESGIALTANPMNNDHSRIIIEVKGVHEHHEVQKSNLRVFNQVVSTKNPLLQDKDVITLAEIAKKLEQHFYFPQEVYWAIEKNKIYILRTKTLHTNEKLGKYDLSLTATKQKLLAKGIGVSSGIASGRIKIVHNFTDANTIALGDIVLLNEALPSYLSGLKKAGGLIAEVHGRTSYTAQIARELGIPAVIGVEKITTALKPNHIITVNGQLGEIYGNGYKTSALKTATRIFVTLSDITDYEYKAFQADGVLIDDQKIINSPKKLEDLCKLLQPSPIVYKLADYEDTKKDRLGFRGTFRSLSQKDALEKELQLIKQIREKSQTKNLWGLIPFMRNVRELVTFKDHLKSAGIDRGTSFKLWMTVASTSNVIKLEEFIAIGIDGICIDLDELTALITGVDKNINEVAHLFDPLDKAVLWALEQTIKTAQKHSLSTAIYGQSVAHHPALIEMLVNWSIGTICVDDHAKNQVTTIILKAEKELVENKYT